MLISKVVASTRREDHPKGRRLTTVSFSDILRSSYRFQATLGRTVAHPTDVKTGQRRGKSCAHGSNKRKRPTTKREKVQTKKKINTEKKHTQLYHNCVCANETDCVSRAGLWTCQPPCGYCAHSSRRGLASLPSASFFVLRAFRSNTFSLDSFYFVFSSHHRRADTFLFVKYQRPDATFFD